MASIKIRKSCLLCGVAAAGLFSAPALAIAAPAQTAPKSLAIETVVVTAERRPESARTVSGSVSAYSGAELASIGAQGMADYLTRTPGVVFNASTPGNSSITIRGVSTSTGIPNTQSTTAYFINGVPLTDPGYSVGTPDIDTFDVNRVTILRGPQGTLFGSSSMGGSVNYHAAKPDLSNWAAHLQGTFEGVDGGGTGGSGKVMLNAPILSDTLAVRGVYYYRQDPGYISNIGTGQKNANFTLVRGGRIEVLWKPAANTSISYLFLDQTEDTGDDGYQEPQIAGLMQKNTLVPEASNFETLIHSIRWDQKLPFGTLTAMASYHQKTQYTLADYTSSLGFLFPGASPVTLAQPAKSWGETYEIRFASLSNQAFEYVIGLFYDQTREEIRNVGAGPGVENSIEANYSPLFGPGIGALSAPNNVWLNANLPTRGQEEAIYGQASYHINSQWKVTFGGRGFSESITSSNASSGFYDLLTAGVLTQTQAGKQSATGFIPKGAVTWTPNKDFMAYALVSEGYRLGGPNIITSTPADRVPAEYGSDSLVNYELGVRSDWLNDRLQLDATAFYIDWSKIQLPLQTSTRLNYVTNAGAARNYGMEASAAFALTDDLTLSGNATYLSAKLSKAFNPGGGQPVVPSGTTLPGASKWLLSGLLTYQWADAPYHPTFVLSDRFVSHAPGTYFTGAPEGGYNLVDARVSFNWGNYEVTGFVENIGNSHGVTSGYVGPLEQYIVQPRTFGLTFDYRM